MLTGENLPAGAGWPLERRPYALETTVPAVFAAGDVRHGSVKRVASGVGEGSTAIQLVHRLFASEQQDSWRSTDAAVRAASRDAMSAP